ncbi:MAG: protein kinase [Myxococcota bacterium]
MLKARQTLGKYSIRRRLAEGGFGQVYEAFDKIEGMGVAIKLPHKHLVTPQMLGEFRKEVRHAAALDHPNILPIKNAQFIDGQFVIVYPLGECTLADRLRRRLSLATRITLVEQMLEAVAHAHAHRIIHCDVKPENLILFSGPRLRLTDFGTSRVFQQRTLQGSGSGTVGYVAPEQAMGRPTLRSDVFSLGIIIYEMFACVLPEWPYDWPPVGHDRLRRTLHPQFIALIRRAMSVKQARRFENAIQMLTAFQRLKTRRQILAPAARKRRRAGKKRATARDWRLLRRRQFVRNYGRQLAVVDVCGRCAGPVSESMMACPWCGVRRARHTGKTRRRMRCPRCKRGRNPDWSYCPWCYGPGFRTVSERSYKDAGYTARCSNRACERRALAPFMRYCPWCHRRVRRPWKITGSSHQCSRCRWAVLPAYWRFCPWCGKSLPPGRTGSD